MHYLYSGPCHGMFALLRTKELKFLATDIGFQTWIGEVRVKGKMKPMDKLILLDIALSFNASFRLKELWQV